MIIPELQLMMENVATTYEAFNASFSATPLPDIYLNRFNEAVAFVNRQSAHYSAFDHFSFIKDYINPLFLLNQKPTENSCKKGIQFIYEQSAMRHLPFCASV